MLTQQNVLGQIDHLRTYPSVASRLLKGELRLHGWVYHIETGVVNAYDPSTRSSPQLQTQNRQWMASHREKAMADIKPKSRSTRTPPDKTTLARRLAYFIKPVDARYEDLRGPNPALNVLRDFTAGLIVAMVAIPLAMGFAMASGLRPEQGIVGGAVAGMIGALFGEVRSIRFTDPRRHLFQSSRV